MRDFSHQRGKGTRAKIIRINKTPIFRAFLIFSKIRLGEPYPQSEMRETMPDFRQPKRPYSRNRKSHMRMKLLYAGQCRHLHRRRGCSFVSFLNNSLLSAPLLSAPLCGGEFVHSAEQDLWVSASNQDSSLRVLYYKPPSAFMRTHFFGWFVWQILPVLLPCAAPLARDRARNADFEDGSIGLRVRS